MSNKDVVTDEYSLLFGDCLERMKEIPDASVDLILTDPPYQAVACSWDNMIPFEPMWEQLKRIIKPNGAIVLFGSEPFSSMLRCSNLKMFKYDWVWNKTKPQGFLNAKARPLVEHELIHVFSSGTCTSTSKTMTYNPQGLINVDVLLISLLAKGLIAISILRAISSAVKPRYKPLIVRLKRKV